MSRIPKRRSAASPGIIGFHLRDGKRLRQRFLPRSFAFGLILLALMGKYACGQIRDTFDDRPGKWAWARNDCSARILSQERLLSAGHNSGTCQAIRFAAATGTRAELIYGIEPVEVIQELKASLWFWASKPGARISIRVRFPYTLDPRTREPAVAYVSGTTYRSAGTWQRLQVAKVMSGVTIQEAVLRNRIGRDIDLRQPYVDALLVNVYTGPGTETIRFDDLQIDNAIPAQRSHRLLGAEKSRATRILDSTSRASSLDKSPRESKIRQASHTTPSNTMLGGRTAPDSTGLMTSRAFDPARITRFIEYNGEALEWLKSNGFTGAVFSEVPTAQQLREAMRLNFDIIAPAVTSTRQDLANLLAPVVAWDLGDALLEKDAERTRAQSGRLRRLPSEMRRELVANPLESHGRYVGVADYLVFDLPSPARGLTPDEEQAFLTEQIKAAGSPRRIMVGVSSGPTDGLRRQVQGIAESVQAAEVQDFGWHATWLQTIRALEIAPRGIVFRSSTRLDSGRGEDYQRSSVLRFINQLIQIAGPLIAGGNSESHAACFGAAYRAKVIRNGRLSCIIATSTSCIGTMPRAGDGTVLKIAMPSGSRSQEVVRLTSLQPERLQHQQTQHGLTVGIVAPDFAEILLVSSDQRTITQIGARLRQLASSINFERGQLVNNSLMQTRIDWQVAGDSQVIEARHLPVSLLQNALTSLTESSNRQRAGDVLNAYRLTRRADAWEVRARSKLADLLAHEGLEKEVASELVSHPALLAPGAVPLHLRRPSRERDGSWRLDPSMGDPFRNPSLWESTGWTHDRRREDVADLRVEVVDQQDSVGRKDAGLRTNMLMVAKPRGQSLPGGYAGTTLRARSAKVPAKRGDWLRIDARVRVDSRDTRAHRGLLVYDTFGGADIGVFVRPAPQMQSVRMFRYATSNQPLRITFELMGEGEVRIDELKVYKWLPHQRRDLPFRPIVSAENVVREPNDSLRR